MGDRHVRRKSIDEEEIVKDKKLHWRFEHIDGKARFRMINRFYGKTMGSEDYYEDGDKWVFGMNEKKNDHVVRIFPITFPEGRIQVEGLWTIKTELGSSVLNLYWGNDHAVKVDRKGDTTKSLMFYIDEVDEFFPADLDSELSSVPRSTKLETTTNDITLGLVTNLAWSVKYAGGVIAWFIELHWQENSLEKSLKTFAKQIRAMTQSMIADSHALQNLQRANDLLAINRRKYLISWGFKKSYWLSTHPDNEDKIMSNIVTPLADIVYMQHVIIAENLVDLDYDDTDEVSIRTAQQGFTILKHAVAESLGMVQDYSSLLTYALAETPCEDIAQYVAETTGYADFVEYLDETYQMVSRKRFQDIDKTLYVSGLAPYYVDDEYYTEKIEVWSCGYDYSECEGARDDYYHELLWDMEHFSYGFSAIQNFLDSFPQRLEEQCYEIRNDLSAFLNRMLEADV